MLIDDDDAQSRIQRISTQWTEVFDAHQGSANAQVAARISLLHRYRGAVYRYLLAVVRDVELAEEFCQEFAVKFLNGDFHRADPKRGRFRDYLKTALINHVRASQRGLAARPQELRNDIAAEPEGESGDSSDFHWHWRRELLEQTWQALAVRKPVYYALLLMRSDEPHLTSRS